MCHWPKRTSVIYLVTSAIGWARRDFRQSTKANCITPTPVAIIWIDRGVSAPLRLLQVRLLQESLAFYQLLSAMLQHFFKAYKH